MRQRVSQLPMDWPYTARKQDFMGVSAMPKRRESASCVWRCAGCSAGNARMARAFSTCVRQK